MGKRVIAEQGATLIELLVAITIIGLAVVAVVGGMATSVSVSDVHRKQATSDAAARSIAELIKSDSVSYAPCASPSPYPQPVPSGYTATVSIGTWNGSPSPAAFTSSCPSPDPGLQQVTVVVRSADQRDTETVVLLKRRK